MKKTIYLTLYLLLGYPLYADSSSSYIVTAKSGLILRKSPSIKSEKLELIPFGSIIKRINNYKKEDSETLSKIFEAPVNYNGLFHSEYVWYNVEFNGKYGYAFSYFLIPDTNENKNHFLYNYRKENISIFRDFIPHSDDQERKNFLLVTKITNNDEDIINFESPVEIDKTAFFDDAYLYISRPIEGSERQGYEGGYMPYFYERIVKIDLSKKNESKQILMIAATPELSFQNSQISIIYNNSISNTFTFDFPKDDEPILINNDKNIKINKKVKKALLCLTKHEYFIPHNVKDPFDYKGLIQFSLKENSFFWKNHIIKLKICNTNIEVKFKQGTIN